MVIQTEHYQFSTYQSGSADAIGLILILPGFLDTKDYSHMRHHVEAFGQAGFQAISFDPPGTWESDGEIADYTMSHYLRAVDELISYFNKPVLLMGHSLGGTIAMLVAAHNPRVVGVVSVMSVHAFVREDNYQERVVRWQREGMKTSTRDLPNNPKRQRTFTLPYSFSQDAQQYDVRRVLQTIRCPKLFIAGADDTIAPQARIKELYDAAPEPKKLAVIAGDHDYRRHNALIQEISELSVAFALKIFPVGDQ